MLQRVAAGQVRFSIPGLLADARGVVVGRHMLLRFPALDRLVSFLRLWSAEQVLDDLQPSLRLMQARAPGGTREALALLPVSSVAQADGVARVARTVGGQCFTGTGKQFVQYRDQQAPLGYDVAVPEPAEDGVDFVLHGQDVTLGYAVVAELPLTNLLLRLDLQREPRGAPGVRESTLMRGTLLLTVRRGLGPMVIAYLHRAMRLNPNLRVAAALCEPPAEGRFHRRPALWILRIDELPARLWGVLAETPGLALFVPVADNVAVAVGFRHPVHLGSCKQAFPDDRLFLFSPAPDGVMVVAPGPVFSPVADLVRLQVPGWDARRAGARDVPAFDGAAVAGDDTAGGAGEGARTVLAEPALRPTARTELNVPLRLEAASVGTERAVAALVPWAQLGWIRSLCYALPPSVLRGYRVAFLERGPLIVASDVLDGFPFGQLLHAPAPGLLVPLGWELRPAVSPDELAARLGAMAGALVVFPGADEAPFRIPADAIETLEARVLSDGRLRDLRVETLAGSPAPAAQPSDIDVENQPLGPMPLWRLGR